MVSSESMLVLAGGDLSLSSRPFLAAGCEAGWTGLLRLLVVDGSAFTSVTHIGISCQDTWAVIEQYDKHAMRGKRLRQLRFRRVDVDVKCSDAVVQTSRLTT